MGDETVSQLIVNATARIAENAAAITILRAFRDLVEQVGDRAVTAQDLLKVAMKRGADLDARLKVGW